MVQGRQHRGIKRRQSYLLRRQDHGPSERVKERKRPVAQEWERRTERAVEMKF